MPERGGSGSTAAADREQFACSAKAIALYEIRKNCAVGMECNECYSVFSCATGLQSLQQPTSAVPVHDQAAPWLLWIGMCGGMYSAGLLVQGRLYDECSSTRQGMISSDESALRLVAPCGNAGPGWVGSYLVV